MTIKDNVIGWYVIPALLQTEWVFSRTYTILLDKSIKVIKEAKCIGLISTPNWLYEWVQCIFDNYGILILCDADSEFDFYST